MRVSWISVIAAVSGFLLSASMINHGLVNSRLPAGPGLTLDESFNIDQGVYLAEALEQHGPLMFTPDTAREVFGGERFLPDHPPLGRLFLGCAHQLTSWCFSGNGDAPYCVPAARLGSCAAFGFMILILTEFCLRHFGRNASLLTALMLIGTPHLVGHARLAALETMTNLAWVAAMIPLLSWWTSDRAPSGFRAVVSGVFWGCLLLTKVQGILMIPAVVAWGVWQFREFAIRPLILWGLTGCAVFLLGWPWLWEDPVGHGLKYIGRTTDRIVLYCWYFGTRYPDRLVPWHYPFVMTLATLPAGVLGGLVIRLLSGRWQRSEMLCALISVTPLFVFSVPGVPVYDGTRLFLVTFPGLALLAGLGVARLLERMPQQAGSQLLVPGFCVVLAVIPLPWTLQVSAINQYGPLAGMNQGAAYLGLEASYWGDSLNGDFWEKVPESSTLAVAPVSHQFQLSDLETLVPVIRERKIHLVPYLYEEDRSTFPLLLLHRLADLRPVLQDEIPGMMMQIEVRNSGTIAARVMTPSQEQTSP